MIYHFLLYHLYFLCTDWFFWISCLGNSGHFRIYNSGWKIDISILSTIYFFECYFLMFNRFVYLFFTSCGCFVWVNGLLTFSCRFCTIVCYQEMQIIHHGMWRWYKTKLCTFTGIGLQNISTVNQLPRCSNIIE